MKTDSAMHVLGIDVGGSSIKTAVVDCASGEILGKKALFPVSNVLGPQQLLDLVGRIRAHHHWSGDVGLGFPGRVENGIVSFAGNVSAAFDGVDLPQLLESTLGCRPVVLNDADAAGLAERYAGRGIASAGVSLFLTLGTGVGSALFHDGRLVPNTEFGLMEIHGCVAEHYVGASAIARDGIGVQEWADRLNAFLNAMNVVFAPRSMVLGGAISASLADWRERLDLRARVFAATHDNAAGLIGAALAGSTFRNG